MKVNVHKCSLITNLFIYTINITNYNDIYKNIELDKISVLFSECVSFSSVEKEYKEIRGVRIDDNDFRGLISNV